MRWSTMLALHRISLVFLSYKQAEDILTRGQFFQTQLLDNY